MPVLIFSISRRRCVEVPLPDEPKVSLPGFFLAYSTISLKVLTPTEG